MSEPLNQHHVFVVDDEPIIASTLAMILRGQGFDVRSFIEPLEALKAMLSQPPDLLLTDVMMPLLSGIERLSWRFGCVNTPRIATSCCSLGIA